MDFLLKFILGEKLEEFDRGIAINQCMNCPECNLPFDKGKNSLQAGMDLQCPYCETRTCPDCFDFAHSRETFCKQKLRLFLQSNEGSEFCNICPNCYHFAFKDDNCEIVECKNADCKLKFCFRCAVAMNPIFEHGNHFHRPDCALFVAVNKSVSNNKYEDKISDKCNQCMKDGKLCQKPLSYEQFCKKILGISSGDFDRCLRKKICDFKAWQK